MAKRKIIRIDEEKCNGCGECIPNCPEGALQVIDEKARLVSDLVCDGLGACIGHCPQGAIVIEEREAGAYDERKVMENIAGQGRNVIAAHLEHLRSHGEERYLKEARDYLKERRIEDPLAEGAAHRAHPAGCPGSAVRDLRKKGEAEAAGKRPAGGPSGPMARRAGGGSCLRQWPVQIMLVPVNAPYFEGADLLVAADCVPFAYADFHEGVLKGKILLVGCPKLDDTEFYKEKLTDILKKNNVKSVTCAHMEVPCCFGLVQLLEAAIDASGKKIPFEDITIGIQGERKR